MVILIPFLHFGAQHIPSHNLALSVTLAIEAVLLWFKVLYWMQVFDFFGPLVTMIKSMIVDIVRFLTLALVILIGFGIAFSFCFAVPFTITMTKTTNLLPTKIVSTISKMTKRRKCYQIDTIALTGYFEQCLPFFYRCLETVTQFVQKLL